MSTSIQTLSFDLSGRDFASLQARNLPLLSVPLDNLPLMSDHSRLADLVRASGSKSFAFRLADDHRLLGAWHSSGTAAIVCTYWRKKLAHIDLLFADMHSTLNQDALHMLPVSSQEICAMDSRPRPLLLLCNVRPKVPGLAQIMGLIAYMPSLLNLSLDESRPFNG